VPSIEICVVGRRELRWFEHLIRLDNNRKPRHLRESRDEEMRGRRKAKMKWE
jgi:hypothetical protein